MGMFLYFWDLRCQRPSSGRYWTFRENIKETLQKYISQLSPDVVQKWEGLTCEGVHGACLGTAATATCQTDTAGLSYDCSSGLGYVIAEFLPTPDAWWVLFEASV